MKQFVPFFLAVVVAVPHAKAEEHPVQSLSDGFNGFGEKFFVEIARTPGNKVDSPYSAGGAFSMAMSYAKGETQAEILKAMGSQLTPA